MLLAGIILVFIVFIHYNTKKKNYDSYNSGAKDTENYLNGVLLREEIPSLEQDGDYDPEVEEKFNDIIKDLRNNMN